MHMYPLNRFSWKIWSGDVSSNRVSGRSSTSTRWRMQFIRLCRCLRKTVNLYTGDPAGNIKESREDGASHRKSPYLSVGQNIQNRHIGIAFDLYWVVLPIYMLNFAALPFCVSHFLLFSSWCSGFYQHKFCWLNYCTLKISVLIGV